MPSHHSSQKSEHGNNKMRTMILNCGKQISSAKGTKALKRPNPKPEVNTKFSIQVHPSNLNHGLPHPPSPIFPPLPPTVGWAIWHRNKVAAILDELIAQIRTAPIETLGWFKEELATAWKHIFPITPSSMVTRNLPLDHQAWVRTSNPWWNFSPTHC